MKRDEGGRKDLNTEVRKYPRMEAVLDFTYRPEEDAAGEPRRAKTKTLGLGGLMFESREPHSAGACYRLTLAAGERDLELHGRVAHVDILKNGRHRVGVEFVDVSRSERDFLLSFYIQKRYNI